MRQTDTPRGRRRGEKISGEGLPRSAVRIPSTTGVGSGAPGDFVIFRGRGSAFCARRVPNLRSRIVHGPLCRLHLARPIAIPVAHFLALAALVAFAAEHVHHLAPERLLDNQAQRQPHQTARPAAVPSSPFIKARSSSRVGAGADNLSIGMLPAGQRRQPKARLPVAIQAGCISANFPAILTLHPA